MTHQTHTGRIVVECNAYEVLLKITCDNIHKLSVMISNEQYGFMPGHSKMIAAKLFSNTGTRGAVQTKMFIYSQLSLTTVKHLLA